MQFWSRLHTHCHTDPKHIKKLQAIFGILPFSSSQNCIIQSQHQIQKEKITQNTGQKIETFKFSCVLFMPVQ